MSKRKPGSTLTDKEKMFCTEYIFDLDATNAAIRAGYSEASATTTAYHIKQRPDVAAYIDQLLEEKMLHLRINAKEVLLEIAKIAFAEIGDADESGESEEAGNAEHSTKQESEQAAEGGSEIKPKARSPKYTAASMCRVIHVDPVTGYRTVTWFNLQAKLAALKLLGKHLGIFEKLGDEMFLPPLIIPPAPRN